MVSPERTLARRRKRRWSHENHVFLLALLSGSAALVAALLLLWLEPHEPRTRWTLTVVISLAWIGFAWSVRTTVSRPLHTLANMLAALREGDYSIRVRPSGANDALSELIYEVNALSDALRNQRLGAMETTALLLKVMAEIDVAIFTFDEKHRLRLINRAGEQLIEQFAERALGRTASELGIEEFLGGESARTLDRTFGGQAGRWGLRRSEFRQDGRPHQLLVIADLSRALREEERQAWQRLVRVLGHELNNSLAPVQSIADSLSTMLKLQQKPADWEQDVATGVRVIADRAEALNRFMRDYSRLAKLPKPQPRPVQVETVVRHVAALEKRLPVQVEAGPPLTLSLDPDQFEQLLINLVKNAVDASLESKGAVQVGWEQNGNTAEIFVRDEGPGIANPSNLFVPFFTTKQGGTGIGLALSRQIVEAHNGTISLENRHGSRGCEARVRLPL
ncbi:MAG TPA: ATP-binding protein [Terriglobales bacterium]|nr:ATP-binding protein [Terriglobales bacterium]